MKRYLIVAVGALALGGCLPATKEGRPWYGQSYAGTPEHRALEAKYAAQRQVAREEHDARLERERHLKQINAAYTACQEANDQAKYMAKLSQRRTYTRRDCLPLRRE